MTSAAVLARDDSEGQPLVRSTCSTQRQHAARSGSTPPPPAHARPWKRLNTTPAPPVTHRRKRIPRRRVAAASPAPQASSPSQMPRFPAFTAAALATLLAASAAPAQTLDSLALQGFRWRTVGPANFEG